MLKFFKREAPLRSAPVASEKREVKEEKPLTPKLAGELFVKSFQFSQGSPGMQEFIFDYLHILHPEWKMDDQLKEKVYSETKDPIIKFAFGHGASRSALHGKPEEYMYSDKPEPMTEEAMKSKADKEIQIELKKMQEHFNFGDSSVRYRNLEHVIPSLVANILTKDLEYFKMPAGRPRRLERIHQKTALSDPFLSQICYYGFLGHDTGSEEYNQMFRDMVSLIKLGLEKRTLPFDTVEKLQAVVSFYNEKHPEDKPVTVSGLSEGVPRY